MVIEDATTIATRWFASGGTRGKIGAVYYLLIDRHLIAARIAEILDVNKSTVSRWVRRLLTEQYIIEATDFLEHQKQLKQVGDRSVSQNFKPYVEGPRASQAKMLITQLQSQMGVHRRDPLWSPLPGGAEGLIDIHRLDWNLPLDPNAPNGGKPREKTLEEWEQQGIVPHGRVVRGWIHFRAPDVDSSIGPWRILLRRRVTLPAHYLRDGRPTVSPQGTLHKVLEYGDWCTPNAIRVYRPSNNRWHITAEEALDKPAVERRIYDALFEVIAEIQRRHHFAVGLPKQKNAQAYEAGVLRHDPELARRILEHRQTNPEMLNIAPGITADGSHALLHEGIVHLDADDPRQAAMQLNPPAVLDNILQTATKALDRTLKAADESIETIEEHGVRATDTISNQIEGQLGTIVEQLRNTMEQTLAQMSQQHEAWLEAFAQGEQIRTEERAANLEVQDREDRENAVGRVNRAIDRFERRLRGVQMDRPAEQMTLFDFTDEEVPREEDT